MDTSEIMFQRDCLSLSDVMKLRFYPLTVASGDGAVLRDVEGKEYLDFNAGWGVANTGYNHPRLIRAVCNQMNRLSFASTISVLNVESIELAEKLKSMTPGDFDKKVWYGHSGSDANEFIAKMVPLATGRPKIISFAGSYHGQTMGSYALSGHPSQSRFIAGGNVIKVPYPYCYRCAFSREPETCGMFCLKYIEDYIFQFITQPDQVAAIIMEAVQCDGGDVVPPAGFLQGIEKICKKHGILLIIDEVKVGFGRTGRMFSFEHWNIVPDAVVMGKPLGGGQPLSAVVGRRELMDVSVGAHLFTTAGNPVACTAAKETIQIIKAEKLEENAAATGEFLKKSLESLMDQYEIIGDVRGKGLLIGVELVKDRASKAPADEIAAKVVYRSYELGLLYYYAGVFNNVLELTPPLVISMRQAETAVCIIEQAIRDVLNGKVSVEKIAAFAGWG